MYLTIEDTFPYLNQIPKGHLLEFGVFSGNTMNRLIKGAEAANNPFEEVYGFDSFTGIPKETEGVKHNPEWPEHAFSLCHDFGLVTVGEAIDFVHGRVERKDIKLVPGYFEWSLQQYSSKLVNKANYIHIDVDIYRSTVEVLNFVLGNKIAKVGSLWRYDDTLWCNWGEAGNTLAHIEMTKKYKIAWNQLSDNVFQLINYGT